MRLNLLITLMLIFIQWTGFVSLSQAAQPKDWTFLIFLNGKNNLDSYGEMNLNQMEKIGSTDRVNIVVQWASLANKDTRRILIQKDHDTQRVTSTVIQNMGQVDMGDYHSLIDFVRWGSKNFPAEHYFINVWDHGSGWHLKPGEPTKDISWDDTTGNHITTEQLALAIRESAKIIGHKVDIYGSDACLMAMVEIAKEMEDSVSVFLGSEETEPADGWPYDTFLDGWNKLKPDATAGDVAGVLTREYQKYYQAKSSDITLSAFDLSQFGALTQSLRAFSDNLKSLNKKEIEKITTAAKNSTHFTNDDYVDLGDFIEQVKSQKVGGLNKSVISELSQNTKNFIAANATIGFPKATGAAIWIPTDSYTYQHYADRYSRLSFDAETHWGDVAKAIAESAK